MRLRQHMPTLRVSQCPFVLSQKIKVLEHAGLRPAAACRATATMRAPSAKRQTDTNPQLPRNLTCCCSDRPLALFPVLGHLGQFGKVVNQARLESRDDWRRFIARAKRLHLGLMAEWLALAMHDIGTAGLLASTNFFGHRGFVTARSTQVWWHQFVHPCTLGRRSFDHKTPS